MTSFEDVLQVLPSLTAAQRREVAFRCQQLGAGTTAPAPGGAAPEELFWSGFTSVLAERGIVCQTAASVSRLKAWPAFAAVSKELVPWIDKHFGPRDMVELARSFRIIAKCVVDVVESMRVPMTPSVLLQQARNATQAVAHGFPDYLRAGLLRRWILLAHS